MFLALNKCKLISLIINVGFIFNKKKEIKKYNIIFLNAKIPFESSMNPIINKNTKTINREIISEFKNILKLKEFIK